MCRKSLIHKHCVNHVAWSALFHFALHREEAPIRYVLDKAEKLPKSRSDSPIINFFERIEDLIYGVFAFGYLSLIILPFILLFGWLILEAGEFFLSMFSG